MLRDTTSRGLFVRVWPPHTSEYVSVHVTRKLSSVQRGPSLLLTGVVLKSPLDAPLDSLFHGCPYRLPVTDTPYRTSV